jgi:ribokinase
MEQRHGGIVSTVVQILAIGDANAELVFSPITSLPQYGQEVIVPKMHLRAAGSATNFALCAAHLGVKTGFAGRLAVDKFGEVVLKALREADVDTQWLRLVEDSETGMTLVLVREDGERAFITYQGTNAELQQQDLEKCFTADPPPRWVHLAGYHLLDSLRGPPAISLLKLAQERGITTSLDTGWDPKGWTNETIETLHEALQFVDVFFPNVDEIKALTGEKGYRKGAQNLIKMGAPALVVKLGKRGCLLATKQDEHLIPAFEVSVVDTTAAGDAFNAGFVVSMLGGATMGRAAVFGNAVAALRISRQPHQPLFPSLQETTAFLMRKRPLEA